VSRRSVNKARFPAATDVYAEPKLPAAPVSVSVVEIIKPEDLWFASEHETPGITDLTFLSTGQFSPPPRSIHWGGPLTGRPRLISQLFHALRVVYSTQSEHSLRNMEASLRAWWRVFDRIESGVQHAGVTPPAVNGVEDLADIHWRLAVDSGLNTSHFGPFVLAASLTRQALGLKPLYWYAPRRSRKTSHVPDYTHVRTVRDELKRLWFAVLDRWEEADGILWEQAPADDRERNILRNYNRLMDVQFTSGLAWPTSEQLGALTNYGAIHPPLMAACAFPNRFDVRAAFHLCLVSTGWNSSTLLNIDVNKPFLRANPKDPSRYLLEAYKARSKSFQTYDGMFKTMRSPGVVILMLIERNAPLRAQLREKYEQMKAALAQDCSSNAKIRAKKRLELANLEAGLRSPWLFAGPDGEIGWLNLQTCSIERGKSYMRGLIDSLNERRRKNSPQVPYMTAGDLRDAYAAFVYEVTGGMVLAVMRALGHKRARTTQDYLNSRHLNDQSWRIYLTFNNHLWTELEKTRRVDPTIMAALMRNRRVTQRQRNRLAKYRELSISRIGVGCQDIKNPPAKVAPGFRPDGRKSCPSHRCTLCLERAVITPESLDGLAMRWCELTYARENLAPQEWVATDFAEEFSNLEMALLGFERALVLRHIEKWQGLIAHGKYVPVLAEVLPTREGKS
jgi:hypothetical protein